MVIWGLQRNWKMTQAPGKGKEIMPWNLAEMFLGFSEMGEQRKILKLGAK
jgi:hypothetical protein